jgi:hypothetical protein
MPNLRFTLLIEEDGAALPNMPIVQDYPIAESTGVVSVSQAADNNTSTFHPIPQLTMPSLGIFFLTSDQALNLNFNQLSPIALNAGGLILMLGIALTQGTPSQNVEINNPAASQAADVSLIGAGT